jgi:hypothetical protein
MSRSRQSLPFNKYSLSPEAEQTPRYDNFPRVKLLLVEFSATNLEHNLRRAAHSGGGSDRHYVVRWQREDRLVVGEGNCQDCVNLRTCRISISSLHFLEPAGLRVFYSTLGFLGGAGADWRPHPSRRRDAARLQH